MQIPGVDYTESFSVVVTDTTTRTDFGFELMNEDWICECFDVEAGFLNPYLEKEMYIEFPEGIVELGFITVYN